MLKNRKELHEVDSLFAEVLEFVTGLEKVSTSLIQRRFQLGYPRAAHYIELLEKEGYIDKTPDGPRKVLFSREKFYALYGDTSKKEEE